MKTTLLTDPVVQMCRWLEKSDEAIPLPELSSKTGWSISQVHRMFKKKMKMTPHEYWEQIKASRLRQALSNASTVLEGAVSAGYSSMGRLHEDSQGSLGMPPSAYRRGGQGAHITFALGKCWLGHFLVAQTEKGVCAVELGDDPDSLLKDFQKRFPNASLSGEDGVFQKNVAKIAEISLHPYMDVDIPLDIKGTAFQKKVWDTLRLIPPGKTVTYAQVANNIGMPTSVRAVANACANNKIALLIPCHRVVRKDGTPSGYRWGLDKKEKLLDLEKSAPLNANNLL